MAKQYYFHEKADICVLIRSGGDSDRGVGMVWVESIVVCQFVGSRMCKVDVGRGVNNAPGGNRGPQRCVIAYGGKRWFSPAFRE
ncbi:hypothetical protein DPMN_012709 [Dreissena polymorpha]|uniref:Uncharacterized protein n=1 Tax=Dreissena polymorpha TaxID=45954 RepID=A0A9D4N6I2_DREPO|nr:hypothetical protein DPMN_012709 [Dreissena polymorpha]